MATEKGSRGAQFASDPFGFGAMASMSGANPAMQPLAAAAALSALGFGMWSQAFGLWYGAAEAMLARPTARAASARADDDPLAPAEGVLDQGEAVRLAAETVAYDAAHVMEEALDIVGHAVADIVHDLTGVAPSLAEKVAALMPEDFRRPARIDRPDAPDDLKLISGIGPKLEKVLNGLGVWTWRQIADWGAEEIAWVDDELRFSGRIVRDDWKAQAQALARGGRDEYVKVFGREPR